ncbi:MAG TPA: hypothetical protein VNT03_18345 [Baekduia sp.]|nr:hypothetical protein [Baekduia sp.]
MKGSTLYVTSSDGTTIKVTTGDKSKITRKGAGGCGGSGGSAVPVAQGFAPPTG